jgi:hypothetical protein
MSCFHSSRSRGQRGWQKLLLLLLLALAFTSAVRTLSAAPMPATAGSPLVLRTAVKPTARTVAIDIVDQPPPDERPIDQMRVDTRVTGEVPPSAAARYFSDTGEPGTWSGRGWSQSCYMWEASALYHNPLYFEDVPLERYGHALPPPFQPLLSGAKFFGTIPFMSYKMVLEPMNEHVYALGYYRSGSPAPWLWYPIPIRYDATAVEAGVILGLIFVLPFP